MKLDSPSSVPLLLVTGFLGSGKTTLINRFLQLKTIGKLGVVVNEFGQIGIDAALLGPGDILELGGGCVCCSSGTELWESALSLIERAGATYVLIETSGIAEVSILLEQYQNLPAAWKQKLELRGILCLVDVVNLEDSLQKRPETSHQIQAADRLLFSKMDVAQSDQVNKTHHLLDQLSATSERIYQPAFTHEREVVQIFSWAFLKSKKPFSFNLGFKHMPGQLCTFAWDTEIPLLEEPLRRLFQEIAHQLLRAKGFVRLGSHGETSLHVLQFAGQKLELVAATQAQDLGAPSKTTLVFIGEALDEDWIRLRLSSCQATQ